MMVSRSLPVFWAAYEERVNVAALAAVPEFETVASPEPTPFPKAPLTDRFKNKILTFLGGETAFRPLFATKGEHIQKLIFSGAMPLTQ
ncbi:hypothetical protein [uncultured Roseobacter sp.]|uniref:hypothetical protein n=1 Tax=uncultured Roseobacter sp. TaxID=114847 RepID=UPI002608866D|nr:hypothetical protein [uncultured Roseobacter sp.]